MYTASSPEQVRHDPEVPFIWFKQAGQEVGTPPERWAELLPENFREYRRHFTSGASSNYEEMTENVTLFGAPDQVVEKIKRLRQSGLENLILFVNYGGIENKKVMDSLELFAAEVMPQLKN
jgi:alkanesulfonate monooxygenase SsuD/methylene tetrahydromethanopterin reductase-like flavin-dependent oxidoreductase (luciferase family)